MFVTVSNMPLNKTTSMIALDYCYSLLLDRQTDTHQYSCLFSRTTWASWHQRGLTNLDFNEAKDEEVAVVSVGPYANDLHFAPDR